MYIDESWSSHSIAKRFNDRCFCGEKSCSLVNGMQSKVERYQ